MAVTDRSSQYDAVDHSVTGAARSSTVKTFVCIDLISPHSLQDADHSLPIACHQKTTYIGSSATRNPTILSLLALPPISRVMLASLMPCQLAAYLATQLSYHYHCDLYISCVSGIMINGTLFDKFQTSQ